MPCLRCTPHFALRTPKFCGSTPGLSRLGGIGSNRAVHTVNNKARRWEYVECYEAVSCGPQLYRSVAQSTRIGSRGTARNHIPSWKRAARRFAWSVFSAFLNVYRPNHDSSPIRPHGRPESASLEATRTLHDQRGQELSGRCTDTGRTDKVREQIHILATSLLGICISPVMACCGSVISFPFVFQLVYTSSAYLPRPIRQWSMV